MHEYPTPSCCFPYKPFCKLPFPCAELKGNPYRTNKLVRDRRGNPATAVNKECELPRTIARVRDTFVTGNRARVDARPPALRPQTGLLGAEFLQFGG